MSESSTALIQSPPKRKPGPRNALDVPKIPRITALIRAAVERLLDEPHLQVQEVAKQLGCSRTHLSRMLNRPHVESYFARERDRKVKGVVTTSRAAAVYVGLLNAQSEKVQLSVAERMLEEAGTLARQTGRGGTSVNVNVQAGYVIKLRGKGDDEPAIEAQALASEAV